MGRFTVALSEIDLGDLEQAGGKGANLGHLLRAGFNVPPGFSIQARAYDVVLETPGLKDRVEQVLADVDFSDPMDAEMAATMIREAIVYIPLPGPIVKEITSAYRALLAEAGGGLVAVRSSVGTRDLSVTSFPGQMDTYHNLRSEEEVLAKVKECWASAFSYRALVSRHARGINHMDVFVAPVVQAMVDSECAGVIFTANPLSGRRGQMVVNSCLGLGEAVVSGLVQSDHFVLDAACGEVLEERIADKEFKIVLDTARGGGNIRVALDEDERKRPSLAGDQLAELVEAARAIEEYYGSPQDIEWAFAGGKLFILQARRITGLPDAPGGGEQAPAEWICEFDTTVDPRYDRYTLSNISEVLPGVLTPLSMYDIDALDYGFVKANTDFGLMEGIEPESEMTFLGLFYGRAHLNLSVVREMVAKAPGGTTHEFDRRSPEESGLPEVRWRPTPKNLRTLPRIIAGLLRGAMRAPAEVKRLGRENDSLLARARGLDLESSPYGPLMEWLGESRAFVKGVMAEHIVVSELAANYYDFLCKLTSQWLEDKGGVLASRLVTGLQTLESARPNIHIWDLSRQVASSEELRELFSSTPPREILSRLESDPSPQAREFLLSLRSFLGEFGYRGVFESEAMLPNWEEDPSYIFSMIANYLDADPSCDPHDHAARQEKTREEATLQAMGRLNPLQRPLLRYFIKQSQDFIYMREFMKAVLVKLLAQGKMIYHALSRRFAREGMIAEPDDLFFLTRDEIRALALGQGADIAVEELVARRRREYEWNLGVVLPEHTKGRPTPLSPRELEMHGDVEALSGIAVSPGRVTGRARVITDPRSDAEIRPGEILVAPVTDAAWTPLFVTAGAIVVDVGGPLSHGSIVAREYGIPGVLNVGQGTRAIRTGQVITVDGDRGKVYIHPLPGAEEEGAPASGSPGAGGWISEFDTSVDPAYPEYTLSNISEVLPGVLTPLTMSDLDSLDYGFTRANTDFGMMKGIAPSSEMNFLGLFYNRCHLNLSVIKAVAAKVPGGSASEFERREGEEAETWRPTPRNLAAFPALLWKVVSKGISTPREAEALAKEMDARLAESDGRDYESLPYREILQGLEEGRDHLFRAMAMHITVSQFALIYHLFLCRLTGEWLGDEDGMLASRLMTGLQSLESARPSALIWDLSRMVLESAILERIFRENDAAEIMGLLEASPPEEAGPFLASLRAFLAEYGYRGVFEAETMLPSWGEDPSYVFSMILNYLEADAASNPRDLAARQDRERDEALREMEEKLKGLKLSILEYVLKQAQQFISLREFMKSYLIKGISHAKKVYRILGRRYCEDGVIAAPEHIYFLTRQEITEIAAGGELPVEELVYRRRREYERNLAVTLPPYSRGRPVPLTREELEPREDIETLSGIGVSPGKVTGMARVITDPRSDAEIRPGEILVAPVTDAAWTPLFVTAAATVVDVGGPLSHGSIVAREFGIPCVVNAGSATRIIRNGQLITVDGSRGKVYLHPAEK
ncbi:MAG: hypothetical protein JW854_10840 [Actinobacteria bacterium]|nr:hypothetical protein [Actinomycetota bacterium]